MAAPCEALSEVRSQENRIRHTALETMNTAQGVKRSPQLGLPKLGPEPERFMAAGHDASHHAPSIICLDALRQLIQPRQCGRRIGTPNKRGRPTCRQRQRHTNVWNDRFTDLQLRLRRPNH